MKKKFTTKPISASASVDDAQLEADIRREINILFLDAQKLKNTPNISSIPSNLNYLSNRIQKIERDINEWQFRERLK